MKTPVTFLCCLLMSIHCSGNILTDEKDRLALEKTTAAIRDAFGRGDVAAVVALHHPDVIKAFGPNSYIVGRDAVEAGLKTSFETNRMEFVGHKLQSLVFNGDTAIEISIFTIKVTPKNGGESRISRGRAMVVYVKYPGSPTGWASLREMAQGVADNE